MDVVAKETAIGFSPAVERILKLPEDKIDVGIVALTLAKEFYPNLDIAAYSKRLDVLAEQVRQMAMGTTDPETRVRILNTVLFRNNGFHYDHAPDARQKDEYLFLNGILDTKQGICYTMPLLYIAVAQRVGYPIYPVEAPDHVFARYESPFFREKNIETTSGGKYFPDQHYIEAFAVSKTGLANGSYMRTLTYRQYLAQMLAANATVFGRRADPRIRLYLERAIQFNPKFADNYYSLGGLYLARSAGYKGPRQAELVGRGTDYLIKAKELGYVSSSEIDNARRIRGQ